MKISVKLSKTVGANKSNSSDFFARAYADGGSPEG
jgi:hypothetical protein